MQNIDQLNASLIAARCCDALEPCDDCQDAARIVRQGRRNASNPAIPAPRKPSALSLRLALR